MSSSESELSDTIDPMAIVSDDEVVPDPEILTSDTESSDDDDFQPFALPDLGDIIPLADGFPGEDLLLVPIPAPLPLAAFPLEDLPLDALHNDDIDLFIEGLPEGVPRRYHTDSGSDTVMSAAPVQDFKFDDEFDPNIDPEHEVDFIPDDQLFDVPADLELAPVDPEPMIAPEPIPAHGPLPEHDPVPVDIPDVAPPLPDPIPAPVDHAPFATQIDPYYAFTRNGWIEDDDDLPPFVRPVTPPPAPTHAPVDIAPIHPHVSATHCTDLSITFL
ncbi:uncharacterized protein LOC110919471 [Helianthus annuus]|uniref:uncharacterized protein LOC110919471 n=1 Tax=Helianthus annuus TaxID=4232 RepID=UPI000B8F989C|nr:uncharacterized protein LOC110919471 [Helianthus annuus]